MLIEYDLIVETITELFLRRVSNVQTYNSSVYIFCVFDRILKYPFVTLLIFTLKTFKIKTLVIVSRVCFWGFQDYKTTCDFDFGEFD